MLLKQPHPSNLKKTIRNKIVVEPKLSADAIIPKVKNNAMLKTTEKVIVVGASTGGTEALRIFLESFPLDSSGIVIVQAHARKFYICFCKTIERALQNFR